MKLYPVDATAAVVSNIIAFPIRSASGLASQEELDFYERLAEREFDRTEASDLTRAWREADCLLTELCYQRRPNGLAERYAALRDMSAKLTYRRPEAAGEILDFVNTREWGFTGDLAFAVRLLGDLVERSEARTAAA